MQYVYNTALTLALIMFVTVASLALIVATWFMLSYLLNGSASVSLPSVS